MAAFAAIATRPMRGCPEDGLAVEKTHIGMFDVGQCRKAIEIIEKETKGDRYGRYQKDPR